MIFHWPDNAHCIVYQQLGGGGKHSPNSLKDWSATVSSVWIWFCKCFHNGCQDDQSNKFTLFYFSSYNSCYLMHCDLFVSSAPNLDLSFEPKSWFHRHRNATRCFKSLFHFLHPRLSFFFSNAQAVLCNTQKTEESRAELVFLPPFYWVFLIVELWTLMFRELFVGHLLLKAFSSLCE